MRFFRILCVGALFFAYVVFAATLIGYPQERTQKTERTGDVGAQEYASSTESIFGKDSTIDEKTRLEQSIKNVEEEIRRTEEFLQQKKNEN